MAFRLIPAGEFQMGSRHESPGEEPIHRVRISADFWMAETPVTQRQFSLWTASTEYDAWRAQREEAERHENGFQNRPEHPAERVTRHEAVGYCEWLTWHRGLDLPPGAAAGLPTEAQWEHACRAGSDTAYWSGDGDAALDEVGWYDANSGGTTHRVGEKRANPWGLHDMHGNVWEWCWDEWDAEAYKRAERVDGIVDPAVTWEQFGRYDSVRVVRGGSWGYRAGYCRSGVRDGWRPSARSRGRGFRVCLFPGPAAQSKSV